MSTNKPTIQEIAEADYLQKQTLKIEIENYYEDKRKELGLDSTKRIVDLLEEPGPFFSRNILFAHKDFDRIIDTIDRGKEWAIVSGFNPSGPLHFGHKAMFDILLWLQRQLGAYIYIPITSDETYVVGKANSLREARHNAYEYAIPSIIALGFDPKLTRIYVTSDYPDLYNASIFLSKYLTTNSVNKVFGLDATENPGTLFYMGAVQMAQILLPQLPEFGGPKPTLIPVGIDQHPYITMSRNVARRLGFIPPAELIWKFLIGLKGPSKKMSGSIPDSAIYLTDSPEDIKRKIKSAYSGGSPLASMQKEKGAIVEIDPIFSLLSFNFLNDSEWKKIHESYSNGELMTGELKKLATEYVLEFVSDHQQKRTQAKKNINEFMLTTPLKSVLEFDNLPGISL